MERERGTTLKTGRDWGFDGSLTAGVVVHTGSEATGNSSYQIDLAPGSTTFDTLLDPVSARSARPTR